MAATNGRDAVVLCVACAPESPEEKGAAAQASERHRVYGFMCDAILRDKHSLSTPIRMLMMPGL